MIRIDDELPHEAAAREAMLDRAFGPARFVKTCERLREGRLPAQGLSFIARAGDMPVGTLRFWHVEAGGVDALMLGPLAVDERLRAMGIGRTLMQVGLARAAELGHRAIILVGDEPYYARFGFSRQLCARLVLPGPVDQHRFLGCELLAGSLKGAEGLVRASGTFACATASMTGGGHRRRAA
jgi:predicted N-acetyltransferase YhbS